MIEKAWCRVLRDDLEMCRIRHRLKKRYYNLTLLRQKIEKVQRCRKFRKKPKSVKTKERKIRTLSGETHLKFALKRCRCHGADNRQILKAIVPEDSNFDMKMVDLRQIPITFFLFYLNEKMDYSKHNVK